jgi:hypothetical protein
MITFLLDSLPSLSFVFLLFLTLDGLHEHSPLLLLLNLYDLRIGILIGPFYKQNLIAIEGLILHTLFGKFSHTPMNELYEGVTLMRENVNIFDFTPHGKVSQ